MYALALAHPLLLLFVAVLIVMGIEGVLFLTCGAKVQCRFHSIFMFVGVAGWMWSMWNDRDMWILVVVDAIFVLLMLKWADAAWKESNTV